MTKIKHIPKISRSKNIIYPKTWYTKAMFGSMEIIFKCLVVFLKVPAFMVIQKKIGLINTFSCRKPLIGKIFFEIQSPSNQTQPKPKIYLIRKL